MGTGTIAGMEDPSVSVLIAHEGSRPVGMRGAVTCCRVAMSVRAEAASRACTAVASASSALCLSRSCGTEA